MNKCIKAEHAPAAIGPYSHAVAADGFLFTSGQIALVPETGKIVSDNIEEQTEQVLDNLSSVLAANQMTFADVVKTNVYITDLNDFSKVNAIYEKRFGSNKPARSCVQVAGLPGGSKIEIELIAHKSK